MNIDINDMMVFLTVVESGSFTVAGDRLGIPKANVSRKVSRLEERLGVRLLERTTRAQHLTEAGKRYLNHCKRIQEEVDLAEVAVSELMHCYCGSLRVGASVAIGQQVLQSEISRFMHQFPEIDIQLNLVNRRVDLIEEGFDILIRVGELEDSRLVAKPLGRVERKLYASPDYLQRAPVGQIEDLEQRDILVMGSVHGSHSLDLMNGNLHQQMKVEPRLLADDFAIVKQGVLDGLGVAMFPEYMCAKEVEADKLVQVLPEWGSDPVTIYALYPQHRIKIPKVEAFLEFCTELFEKKLT